MMVHTNGNGTSSVVKSVDPAQLVSRGQAADKQQVEQSRVSASGIALNEVAAPAVRDASDAAHPSPFGSQAAEPLSGSDSLPNPDNGKMLIGADRAGSGRTSSSQRWQKATSSLKLIGKASGNFTTLRDMQQNSNIPIQQLKTVRVLGEGAFATVEECLYEPGGTAAPTAVAVKKLKPEVLSNEADLLAFVQEVELLRKLDHRNIVTFIGMGSSDQSSDASTRSSMYLVQEFMEGGTLKRLVSRQMIHMTSHVYSYEDALRWCIQVASGLKYLHQARPMVIHRDLKLENILLKGKGKHFEAKIADFGLVALISAKARGAHRLGGIAGTSPEQGPAAGPANGYDKAVGQNFGRAKTMWRRPGHLTEDQQALANTPQLSGRTGSYMYMAPEMYREEAYDEKVDVFSFAVIMFELFGRYMMICAISHAGTEAEIEQYAERVSQGYRPPFPEKWPADLTKLISSCWAQDPAQRPSMLDVVDRLQKLQAAGLGKAMTAADPSAMCSCVIS